MKLLCPKCGSDYVLYGAKEHPQNHATWWMFECRSCSHLWRPQPPLFGVPIVVNDEQFELVIDEVRTALAGECSCSFAPCMHTAIVTIIEDGQRRARDLKRRAADHEFDGDDASADCKACGEGRQFYLHTDRDTTYEVP